MFLQEYFGLDGKTVLVTGGNRGIGQEVSVDLAKAGARIAVFSRSGAEETVKKDQRFWRGSTELPGRCTIGRKYKEWCCSGDPSVWQN